MSIDRLEESDDLLIFRGKKLYTKYDFNSHIHYFKAHEVANILGFAHIRDMKKYLKEHKIGLHEINTDHGYQLMNTITEDAIYEVINTMRENSIAENFQNFVWYELNIC